LGMGGQFSSFPPHTHPFSTFPFEKVNIFFFCLVQLSFPLEWVHNLYFTRNLSLFWNCMIPFCFGPPLISFLYKMVERFLCPHIFTPITLFMKREIKRVDLCVLKMFSSNFDDFLSSVSSPSYTSDIHKWHLSFSWKNIFFQVLFSHVHKNENLSQKKSLIEVHLMIGPLTQVVGLHHTIVIVPCDHSSLLHWSVLKCQVPTSLTHPWGDI
jgi:hypothetical protein